MTNDAEKDSVEEALEEAKREGEGDDAAQKAEQEAETKAERLPLRAAMIFEIIRREGSGELSRGLPALWWSGVAAGLSIGTSVIAKAMLMAKLPDAPWAHLVSSLGYSTGFLIVIMARQQLFTENTLTAVLPVIARMQPNWFLALMRLWGIVLTANIVGCFVFALFMSQTSVLGPDVSAAVVKIGRHLMENTALENAVRALPAGFLIAALVWMLPSAESNEFAIITLMTYLIALGDFTHVIAGSAEMLYMGLIGEASFWQISAIFFLPTLAGNVIGGTALFAVISYAQVRDEIQEKP